MKEYCSKPEAESAIFCFWISSPRGSSMASSSGRPEMFLDQSPAFTMTPNCIASPGL